jgi:Fe-S cluster assembly protein SufD
MKNYQEILGKTDLPTRKIEAYKYSPLNNRLSHEFSQLHELILEGEMTRFSSDAFKIDSLYLSHEPFLSDLIDQLSTPQFFSIQSDQKLTLNDIINYQTVDLKPNSLIVQNINIVVKSNTQLSLLTHLQSCSTDLFFLRKINLIIEKNAHVEWLEVNASNINQNQLISLNVIQKADSNFQHNLINQGSLFARYNITTHLTEPGAESKLFGLYNLSHEQHFDSFTQINHHAAHTESEQLYKGVLSEQARGIFTGKIFVAKMAMPIKSSQLNKNLLLSTKAHVYSQPQLEIYADDVKCSHGSTTGQLGEDELFYLISRGITQEKARQLLLSGFAYDTLMKLKDLKLKQFAYSSINQSSKRD